MTLTKKELMTAIKLCSDAAVQRGLPNMRIRPRSHIHHIRAPFHGHHKHLVNRNATPPRIPAKETISSKNGKYFIKQNLLYFEFDNLKTCVLIQISRLELNKCMFFFKGITNSPTKKGTNTANQSNVIAGTAAGTTLSNSPYIIRYTLQV